MPKRVHVNGLVNAAPGLRKTVGIDTDKDFLVVGFYDRATTRIPIEGN